MWRNQYYQPKHSRPLRASGPCRCVLPGPPTSVVPLRPATGRGAPGEGPPSPATKCAPRCRPPAPPRPPARQPCRAPRRPPAAPSPRPSPRAPPPPPAALDSKRAAARCGAGARGNSLCSACDASGPHSRCSAASAGAVGGRGAAGGWRRRSATRRRRGRARCRGQTPLQGAPQRLSRLRRGGNS